MHVGQVDINTTASMTSLFWLLRATFYSVCNAEKIQRDFSFLPPSNKSPVSRKELSSLAFFTVNVSVRVILIGRRFPLSAGHVLLGDAEPQRCRPGSFQRHSGVTKRAMFFFLWRFQNAVELTLDTSVKCPKNLWSCHVCKWLPTSVRNERKSSL